MAPSSRTVGIIVAICLVGAATTLIGSSAETSERNPKTLVTLVLHQKKSQSVSTFRKQLQANGFADAFPPAGVEVVSWTGSVDMGHVITLRLPNYKIPEVREVIESRKWGNIEPKLYSSYDFEPFWEDMGGEVNKGPDRCDHYRADATRMLIAP
jgi:hypothetical protein